MKILALLFIMTLTIFPQSTNQEFRSTWVITWEYISSSSSVETNKARIRRILDDHKAANMTSVLWQVRQAGTAYYNSSYEPWGSYAGGTYPGFDPLAYAIEEAHKRGLELHAWFNVFASGSTAPGAPAQQHPEWICRDQSGNPMTSNIALSPGLPAVRDYLTRVGMEIVRNYDIDGFHYDYVRWNEYSSTAPRPEPKTEDEKRLALLDGMITDDDVRSLEENQAGRYLYDVEHPYSAGIPAGYTSWEEFWRGSVTKFVQQMNDSIKAVKPWIRISAAAIGKYNWSGWQGYGIVYQDAALWYNMGYIDQLTPMHYHWTTAAGFTGMLNGQCPQCWGQFIQPGTTAGRLFTVGPGSYILAENNVWQNHPDIINATRNVPFVDGFQFFSYGSWRDKNYFTEAGATFFKRRTKIRDTRTVKDTVPEAPSLSITKIDSLNYRLKVTPHASSPQKMWYILYRNADASINTDQAEIVDISFASDTFTVTQSFSGLQDFNGIYNYGVTAADRYWNESPLSNLALTDSVPSFAPVVLSSVPAMNDTVGVSSQIKLNFSKSMNRNSVITAIETDPQITFTSALWTADSKSLTLVKQGNLSFATNYRFSILPSATDINGKNIDGDANGVPGDTFNLYFRTEDIDLHGPALLSVYPDTSVTGSIDAEDVLSLLFDELVAPATVTHANIQLTRNGTAVTKDMRLTTEDGKSRLSLKPQQRFTISSDYELKITSGVTDLGGNGVSPEIVIPFSVNNMQYSASLIIDPYSGDGLWWNPQQSGSTIGIVDSGTGFDYSTEIFLPATSPQQSGMLRYQWNPSAGTKLLRNYLSGGPPRDITFDTSYTLQMYIYGDGGGSRFRFALDEGNGGTSWPNHEVSVWFKINWRGWKLVEWQLNDPSKVGAWLGNGQLDLPLYRIDSFQMTDDAGADPAGRLYLDNMRIVKKTEVIVTDVASEGITPSVFNVRQNYPNPFNPATTITFSLPSSSFVTVEVFNSLGERSAVLLEAESLDAGEHTTVFHAAGLPSGTYFVRVSSAFGVKTIKAVLMK
ncbi:MAG: hypothetical protein FMNOHCHN_01410 [Ignavibacteriaceae bacterium]|nr:hypothetical protein [Ignavibacteriaceae bacterium]